MIDFFQRYLSINTAMPNPDYASVIALFEQQAHNDGFKTRIVNLPNDYNVLVITFVGSDTSLPAIILNHHMDVVPAPDHTEWHSDPFIPLIKDGYIYARGTQDMKGVGVAHYFALQAFKNQGYKPRRTIHLVLVPDEERGGFNGTCRFVQTDAFKELNAGYVLDEGISSGKAGVLQIKVSERKPIQIQLVSKGEMYHGSRLGCFNAAHELITFLHHMVMHQNDQSSKIVTHPAGLLLSMNVTSLSAGVFADGVATLNVVGDTAQATVDIRVPPSMLLRDVLAYIDGLLHDFPRISYTVIHTVNERSFDDNYRNELFNSLATSISDAGFAVDVLFMEGTTDLRFYLEKQLSGFGLTPFTTLENLHGTNECISLVDLEKGKEVFLTFLKNFCL